jgi:hypothetical protein
VKRWRAPKAKPGELKAQWGKVEGEVDLCFAWGGAGATKSDSALLQQVLANKRYLPSFKGPLGTYETENSLVEELEARGYDITTIRFSIQKKATGDPDGPA